MRSAALRLYLYNLLILVFGPVLLLLKLQRHRKRTEEIYEFAPGRWNVAPLSGPKPGERRIVLVSLGWGEVSMMESLSRELESSIPNSRVVWSLRDPAACRMVRERFPERGITLMPFDSLPAVASWWRAVEPEMVVVVEKFWWPNLVWYSRLHGAKVALVNGRSRGRKTKRYQLLTGYQRWILQAFHLLVFGDQEQISRVADILPAGVRAEASGNIKFAVAIPQNLPGETTLDAWLSSRATGPDGAPFPLLVAGSTHGIDEEWLLQVWQEWTDKPDHCLLIAPRALWRCDEAVMKWQAAGEAVSRRSNPTPGARILLLDTMGELPYVYRGALAAHVGGAVSSRGHNILEPLMWGVPVSYGPNRGDFESVQILAETHDVGVRLHTPQDLLAFWKRAFEDIKWREGVPDRSRALIAENAGAIQNTVSSLTRLLESS